MNPRLTVNDTVFASATRAEHGVLQHQRDAFLSDASAVALLEAMPGAAMILNRHRRVLLANKLLRETLDPADPITSWACVPGELLHCVRASVPAVVAPRTPARSAARWARCLECLSTHKRITRECRIRTAGTVDGGALDLRVHRDVARDPRTRVRRRGYRGHLEREAPRGARAHVLPRPAQHGRWRAASRGAARQRTPGSRGRDHVEASR